MNNIGLSAWLLTFTLVSSIVACTSKDDSNPPVTPNNTPSLTGSYYGSVYNINGLGAVQTIKLDIVGVKMTALQLDNQNQNVTGNIGDGNQPGFNYILTNSDQSKFGLIKTANGKYFALSGLDNSGSLIIGILEKDATAHDNYSVQSFYGSWSGLQYHLDNNLAISSDIDGYGGASASFAADGNFIATGVAYQVVSDTGVTLDASSNLGLANGSVSIGNVPAQVKSLFSPTSQALINWNCYIDAPADFSNCHFNLMEKSSTLINVELAGNASLNNDALRRSYHFLLGDLSTDPVSCTAIRPLGVGCGVSTYYAASTKLKIPLSGTVLGGIAIDFAAMSGGQMLADYVNSDGVIDNSGHAKFAHTRLRVRSQAKINGQEYTVVVLQNPDPSYGKAVLSGAGSMPIVLWDNAAGVSFNNRFDSFIQDSSDDGIPTNVGAYVSINSANDNARLNTDVTYEVQLSDHISGDASKTQNYRLYYSSASSASMGMTVLPSATDIQVDGTAMGAYIHIDSAATIADTAPHVITWPVRSDVNVSHWQVRLRVVNGGDTNYLKNREFRSERIAVANLAIDPVTGERYQWKMPWTFSSLVSSGDVVLLQIVASNSDNSLAAQSPAVFITP